MRITGANVDGAPGRERSGGPFLERDLRALIDTKTLRSVYQPIVDLETRLPVAYEALIRGPAGSPLEFPSALFQAARDSDLVAELDWACRVAAIEGAIDAGMTRAHPLFINVESSFLDHEVPPHAADALRIAQERLHLVIEFTERGILDRPAALLDAVNWIRLRGWGIAVDDVGPDPGTVVVLPLLDPDIIKLDLSLLRSRQTDAQVAQLCAVLAQTERRDGIVVAEGIETESQAVRALGMGARLGQGFLLGRPGPLIPPTADTAWAPALWRRRPRMTAATPVDAVFGHRAARRANSRDMLGFSHHLEQWALATRGPAIILATFQTADRFDAVARAAYAHLARRCLLVAVAAEGITEVPIAGVREWDTPQGDPLHRQLNVIILGTQVAAALIARQSDHDRDGYEYVLTFDRALVVAAARALLACVPSKQARGPELGRSLT